MKSKITLLGFMGIMQLFYSVSASAQCNDCDTVADPSGVEVWDMNNNPGTTMQCIIVRPGKTLTIEGLSLEFYCNTGKITVERGGKLILKNTTITSRFDNTTTPGTPSGFEGILVKGDADVHHMDYYRTEYDPSQPNFSSFGGYNPAHGILIMQNCTLRQVLKRGTEAVAAVTSEDGGILELYNNYFENNQTDIYIKSYNKQQTAVESPNAFNIINCTFKRVRDSKILNPNRFEEHVKLENCRRVQLEGCHFVNEYPLANVTTYKDRKMGIRIHHASFTLQKSGFDRKITSLDNTTTDRLDQVTKCPQYTLPFARRNLFVDLQQGIGMTEEGTTTSNKYAGISDCVFYNCHSGIELIYKALPGDSKTDNNKVSIARNAWILDDQHKLPTVGDGAAENKPPFFIKLVRIHSYTISENAAKCSISQINGQNFDMNFVVLATHENGFGGGEVYRNNVDVVDQSENPLNTLNGFSCTGARNNTHNSWGVDVSGIGGLPLFVTCNYFGNLKTPIRIGQNLQEQASLSVNNKRDQAASNEFDNCGLPRMKSKGGTTKYLYFGASDDPDPNNDQPNVEETATTSGYTCPPIGCQKWPTKYIDPNTQIIYQNSEADLFGFAIQGKNLLVQNKSEQMLQLHIISLNGKEVHTSRVPISGTSIHLGHLPKGLYILKAGNSQSGWDSEKMLLP